LALLQITHTRMQCFALLAPDNPAMVYYTSHKHFFPINSHKDVERHYMALLYEYTNIIDCDALEGRHAKVQGS
jgi:hypothetical protein